MPVTYQTKNQKCRSFMELLGTSSFFMVLHFLEKCVIYCKCRMFNQKQGKRKKNIQLEKKEKILLSKVILESLFVSNSKLLHNMYECVCEGKLCV